MKQLINHIIVCCLCSIAILISACKKEKQPEPEPMRVESFYPNSGKDGTLVTIEGSGFPVNRENVKVLFSGKEASLISLQKEKVVVQAPATGATGVITFMEGDRKTEIGTYTYQALSVQGIFPANGPTGSHIRIRGEGFSSTTSPAVVKINSKKASVVSVSDTLLVAEVPEEAGSGAVVVEVDGKTAAGPGFRYQAISNVKPLTGGAGTRVVIKGVGFETVAANNRVDFNGLTAEVQEAAGDQLTVIAPANLTTGPLSVTINGQKITGSVFTIVPPPEIFNVTPLSGPAGQVMTIKGLHFSEVLDENIVKINDKVVPVTAATGSSLTLTIPGGTGNGKIQLSVNDQAIAGPVFKDQALGIVSMTPDNGLAGSQVTIKGTGFSVQPAENIVKFNGVATPVISVNGDATELVVNAPAGLTTGLVSVSRGTLTAESPVRFRRAGVFTVAGGPESNLPASMSAIVMDSKGNLFITAATAVWKITPDGQATVFAGSPTEGVWGGVDGTGTKARFFNTRSLAIDPKDNLYVTDMENVRKVTPAAEVTTFVKLSFSGGAITIDKDNNLYVTQSYNGITRIYPSGATEKAASRGANDPCRPAVDANGTLYFTYDTYEPGIVRYTKNNTQSILFNISGYLDGPINTAQISYDASALLFDAGGNMLIMDKYNLAIRQVSFVTDQVSTLMKITRGFADGSFAEAKMGSVKDMVIDKQGNIYLLDADNKAIRKVFLQ